MTRNVRLPLLPVAEDRERRDRGVELADWIAAPRPPATRGECEGGDRPCPALRCRHHNGLHDQRYSCSLDVAEMADDERTLELVGKTQGVGKERARQLVEAACDKARARVEGNAAAALGIRKRHA